MQLLIRMEIQLTGNTASAEQVQLDIEQWFIFKKYNLVQQQSYKIKNKIQILVDF